MLLPTNTADEVLRVPANRPDLAFSGASAFEAEYRALAKRWHPDVCSEPVAADVLARLNLLRAAAAKASAAGHWGEGDVLLVEGADGTQRRFRYRRRAPFDLGEVVYGATHIGWLIRPDCADLADAGVAAINGIEFPVPEMQRQFEPDLPRVAAAMRTSDGGRMIVMRQQEKPAYMLSDLVAAAGGRLPATAVAWLTSRLLNFACFFQAAGVTHNGLTPQNLFVDHEAHVVRVLGGWWHSAPAGRRLASLPAFAARYASRGLMASKRADSALDRASLRASLRAALGDETGIGIDAPKPMIEFLAHPGTGDATQDFKRWDREVLPASFGPRRFVKLDIPQSAIFGL